ncbi:MAG: 2-amino-4-hydroxy-6-hydroxymethyldihydropteridine diphosphokinase, partial [Saprospiraceae bacterium]|nr:2-amino-4-hydroxy-6-hydroxymethyldihydropteridine diphosphokinase [Saprospiraceae bacterium]
MQVITVLSLGSNVGDRLNYLYLSKTEICNLIGPIQFTSNIYETEPWGVDNQDSYLNQVISVQTNLSPYELLNIIHQIEKDLGRIREIHYGPRTIDIDILYYGEIIIDIENLKIPHPHIQKRRFILVPLSEILPQMHHPLLKKTNQELLNMVKDEGKVTEWQPY